MTPGQCFHGGVNMDGAIYEFSYNGNTHLYVKKNHSIYRSFQPKNNDLAEHAEPPSGVAISSIWLNVTNICNLNCRYCFTPPLKRKKSQSKSQQMTKEIAQKAIIMLANIWKGHSDNRPATIVFFGGEPLVNYDVVEHAVYFANEWSQISKIPFSYAISTNGTLLKQQFIDFFSRERIAVQLSLDGPKTNHDHNRKFHSGSGSYDSIIDGVQRLFNTIPPESVNIRCTIAKGTASISELVRFFMGSGFKRLELKFMSDNNRCDVGLKDSEMEMLAEDVDLAADTIVEAMRCGLYIRPFRDHLNSLKHKRYQSFVCGAGRSALSVDPQGWIYPCHRFHDISDYRISHVTKPFDDSISQKFSRLKCMDIEPCNSCWAVKFCWGCCPAESMAFSKPLGYPHQKWCRMKQLEAKISLKAATAAGYVED